MLEKPPLLSNQKEGAPKERSLDNIWYARYQEIASFEAYDYLTGDDTQRKLTKDHFLRGEVENPTLDYPKLDEAQLLMQYDELHHLKDQILSEEKNEIVKNVYRWRLNEKIAENRLLLAAATGDMRRFTRYSEFIYGKPSPEIFAYTVARIQEDMRLHKEYGPQNIPPEEIDAFLNELPDPKKPEFFAPSTEKLQVISQITQTELGDAIRIEDAEGFYTPEGLKSVFEEALQTLEAEGWVVTIVPGKVSIAVSQERKSVEIPDKLPERRDSRDVLIKRIQGLIGHEIGTHTARRINGERSRLRLLGLGLDRYEGGEEGVATLREEAINGKREDFAGLIGHLAVSLAKGVDGKPRDFREVYTLMERYFYLNNQIKGDAAPVAKRKAAESAWTACVRTFRGTDTKTKGACFTKDIIYREGNIAVWETLDRKQPEIHRWNVGKYDPSNPRHIWVLDQLGITDADLESLDAEA